MKKTEAPAGKEKKWFAAVTLSCLFLFVLCAGLTIFVDPYFHYHAPVEGISYSLTDGRYQNDGIARHFKYDTVITGTSMAENFKTSEADALFNAHTVKITYRGGLFKEVDQGVKRALSSGNDVKRVIRSLDYSFLVKDKDQKHDDLDFGHLEPPEFMTNDNPFDDAAYLLNKSIFTEAVAGDLKNSLDGEPSDTFDEYGNWMAEAPGFGKDQVLSTYVIQGRVSEEVPVSEAELKTVHDNLEQNVIQTALDNPETEFYLFITPYSIYYWDMMDSQGKLKWQLDIEEAAVRQLLEVPNIKLFAWGDRADIVTNADNYKDQAHYGDWINTMILNDMAAGDSLITKENCDGYFERERELYMNFDYEGLH